MTNAKYAVLITTFMKIQKEAKKHVQKSLLWSC